MKKVWKIIFGSTGTTILLLIAGICATSNSFGRTVELQSDNPFATLKSEWLSNVDSYRYRFEIHQADESGNEVVRFLEASGDQRDHTVVVEYDQNGNTKSVLMANPNYIARIRVQDKQYNLEELRDNSFSRGEAPWFAGRDIDPYFVATTMFFMMRANEINGLKQITSDDTRNEWVQKEEASPGEVEKTGWISGIVAISSGGEITEVQVATQQVTSQKISSKTSTARFEDWCDLGEVRIPLVAKYYLENAAKPYYEFRVKSPSDISINTRFDTSTCYLKYYGLPEPGLPRTSAGLSGWWFWGFIVAGVLLILLAILMSRRRSDPILAS